MPKKIQATNLEAAILTVEEAAGYLRVSRTTMHHLFKTKMVPRARIGGRTLIQRTDLDALLARAISGV
ncbi:helix-turn-helix domain-containing protein [Methylobacterium nigriterrae]|uniref:helix-turn-helix domain-containing protein n=1 Tax=Methylobacterium nigriterrae TaxID=3127512 RepID=UPI0030139DEA